MVELERDLGLILRMLIAFVLLLAVYVFFGGFLALAFESIIIAGTILSVCLGAQLYFGPKMALRSTNARIVDPEEHPELHNRISRLSQQADMEKPQIAVMDSDVPNAYATGILNRNAIVAVSEGLLEQLDDDEIDAVIAHELAHIRNRDFIIMTAGTALITLSGLLLRGMVFGRSRRRNNGGGIIVILAVSLITYIISFIVVRALSRYREYAADKGAAQITGNPLALASALRKISSTIDNTPKEDLRTIEGAESLYIESLSSEAFLKLFNTHPPSEQRIKELEGMAAEFETN